MVGVEVTAMAGINNYLKVYTSGTAGRPPRNEILSFNDMDPEETRATLKTARALASEIKGAVVSVWRAAATVPSHVRVIGYAPEVLGADL